MKTATELNITEAEHVALQAVAAGLAAGLYVHKKCGAPIVADKSFNMSATCVSGTTCGTAGCIGGWVAREMNYSVADSDEYVIGIGGGDSLEPLYYPDHVSDWDDITPAIAAEAIYQFLDGKPVDYPALLNSPAA